MTFARIAGDGTNRDPVRRDTGSDDQRPQLQPMSNGATHAQLIAQLLVLQKRAATMPEIEQAKGALMLAFGLTADEAFALLRSYSQNRNVKVRDIAAWLTDNLDTVPRSAATARKMNHLLNTVSTGCHDTTRPDSANPSG